MRKGIGCVEKGRLLRCLRFAKVVLLRVELREALNLESRAQLFVEREVPPFLGARRRIDRQNRVLVLADEMLLDREIRLIGRIVTQMQSGKRVGASNHVPGEIDARSGERVLREVLIRGEVHDVGAERDAGVEEVRVCVDETHVIFGSDDGAGAGDAWVLANRWKVKRVARHFTPFYRMGEVAVEECPAIGLARYRDEIDAPIVEKVGDCGAVDRSGRVVKRDVAGDHETVELEVHGERVAGNGKAVAGADANVAVALD